MELVSTMEINGEEREIADAYAREQIATNAQNIAANAEGIAGLNSNLDTLEYGEVAGGKNKFDFGNKYGYEDKGKLITSVSDKSLSMKTSSQGQTIVYRNKKLENLGKTTISFYSTSTGGDNARLYFKLFDANGNMFTSSNCNFPIGTYNDYYEGWYYDFSSFGDLSITFTMPTNVAFWNLGLGASIGDGHTVTFTNIQIEEGTTATPYEPYIPSVKMLSADVDVLKNDLSNQCKKDDITTNETLIGTFNGKNYYRKLFTGISGSGGSVTVNVGGKIEIYNYYGRAYTYGQSGASDVKYPIPNKNYYIDSQNASETSFQLTIPTSSDTRKVDLVIEYTKVDE